MEINEKTKVGELLKQYPFLRDELAKITDQVSLLDNPITRAVVSRMSLLDVSGKAGLDINTVISKVKEMILNH